MRFQPIGAIVLGLSFALGSPLSLAQSSAKGAAEPQPKVPAAAQSKAAPAKKLVDLNSASPAELKQIPGIGDKEAARIVAARPFRTKAELVTRNLIPEKLYAEIRRLVVVKNPPMPKLPSPGK